MRGQAVQSLWTDVITERELGRKGTAQRVADLICEKIMDGGLKPGLQLPEESLCESLNVSRNTLREAFRILDNSRLVSHQVGRGVFVRTMSVEDVSDIYLTRKIIESSAISVAARTPLCFDDILKEAEACAAAAERGDWSEVGAADLRFHRAIVALARSPRLDAIAVQLTLESRLVFHAFPNLGDFHYRYLDRNQIITRELLNKRFQSAIDELGSYLDDARSHIIASLSP